MLAPQALALCALFGLASGLAIPTETYTATSSDGYTYSARDEYTTTYVLPTGEEVAIYKHAEESSNPAFEVSAKFTKRLGGWNFCGTPSFVNKASRGSPTASDC